MRTIIMLDGEPEYVAVWFAESKYDQHDLLTNQKKKKLFTDLLT